METLRTCQDCGAVMPASHTGSICPKCVLGLAAESPAAQLGEAEGDVIGPYTLRQKIGEGGFGVVWMAEQTQPMQRMVALKVVKAGMDTKQVLARFEAEQQALALLDHPNIAKVLDAGATETGRPYFVMELVKGIPITQFCQEQKLKTKARLALFRDVCSAINHAHQKGIIHRDLKPSNVMVTLHGDTPVAKVIDFGIAKATQQKLTDKTLFTRFEQFLGTPVYMSPEQAALSGLDIDTRSDIYSLGVLLYELLAGKPPFDPKTLLSKGYEEMRRIIREEEPPKPSTKLTETQNSADNKFVNVSPSALKGELDWIIMKAIDKDRGRRYETANAFSADIGRYLENEPVLAAAPSSVYKFRIFVRRNKAASSIAALLVLVLLAVTGVCLWHTDLKQQAAGLAEQRLIESDQARVNAEEAQMEAEGISTYFTSLLEDARTGNTSDGRSITVTAILDDAVKKLKTDLADQPARRAQLQAVIASTYFALGLRQKAIPLQEGVVDQYRSHAGPEHPDTLAEMHDLATIYSVTGRRGEALAIQEDVLALRRKVLGLEHPDTLQAMLHLARYRGKFNQPDEALAMREEILELSRKINGREHPETLRAMDSLAAYYFDVGRRQEALAMRETVLALRRKVLGTQHPHTIGAMINVSIGYSEAGRPDEALAMREEILKLCRKVMGPEHPETALAMDNLSLSYHNVGRNKEALALGENALGLSSKVNGPEHGSTLRTIAHLAMYHEEAGHLEGAVTMREKVLELRRKINGPEHPVTLEALEFLAFSYKSVARWAEALAAQETVLEIRRKVLGPEHPLTLSARHNLANSYFSVGRKEEALTTREDVLTLRRKINGLKHPDTLRAMVTLAISYTSLGRWEKALSLEEEALELRRETLGPEHPDTLSGIRRLADSYLDAGRIDEAIAKHEELLKLRRHVLGPEHPDTLTAMNVLAFSYDADIRRLSEALGMREQVLELRRNVLGVSHASTLNALNSLALSYAKCTNSEQRIEGYRHLAKLYPERSDFHGQLGKHLFHAGRHDEAIGPLRASLALDPSGFRSFHTRVCLSRALQVVDRNDEAKEVKAELGYVPRPLDQSAPKVLETLISPDAEWRWLHPTDGVDPATTVAQFHTTFPSPSFDDSNWNLDRGSKDLTGGFGYSHDRKWFTGIAIGKPRGGERHSAYFRCRFTTSSSHSHIELRCQRDDGLIVYLDGKEVGRDNMPAGADAYRINALAPQTHALDSVHSHDQQIYRIPLRGGIESGEHVLAISLHNQDAESSDLRIGTISLVAVEPLSDGTLAEGAEQVLRDYRRKQSDSTIVLGPEHPDNIYKRFLRSSSLQSEGRNQEAMKEAERAALLLQKVLGAEHPKSILSNWVLSRRCRTLGMKKRALELGARSLSAAKKVLGQGHSTTRMITRDYAVSLFYYGRDSESRSLMQNAAELCLQAADHSALKVMRSMAEYYEASQDINTRISGYRRLIEMKPEEPEFQYHLGKHLFDAKRFKEALPYLESAKESYSTGERALDIRVRLSLALSELDRESEAQSMRESVVQNPSIFRADSQQSLEGGTVIVPPDAEWRWLHPIDGVDPKTHDPDFHQTFFASEYDDSSWTLGKDRPGPTGGFGYGDTWFDGVDIGTPHRKELGHSAYFRTQFTTTESYANLELRCQRDDGIIIYLNGEEVCRDNMLSGEEAYQLPAADGHMGEQETCHIPLTGTLDAGEHILAISLHNPQHESSDLRIGGISLHASPNLATNAGETWEEATAKHQHWRLREFIDRYAQGHDFDDAFTKLQQQRKIGDFAIEEDLYRSAAVFAFLGKHDAYQDLLRESLQTPELSSELRIKLTSARSGRPSEEQIWYEWRQQAYAAATALTDKGKQYDDYYQYALLRGMTAYRMDDYLGAVDWISEALTILPSKPNAHFFALCHAYQALAYHQLSKTNEARTALQEGFYRLPPMRQYDDWWNTVFAYLALREASEMIDSANMNNESLEQWAR